jgi:hypothetical protein
MAYDYFGFAHTFNNFGGDRQALVLNLPDDLSDRDIARYWGTENGIGIKFKPEAHGRLKAQTSDKVRSSAVVVDGEVEFITPPSPAPVEKGMFELYAKVRPPALDRLATSLRAVTNPTPFKFVRSYIEGE